MPIIETGAVIAGSVAYAGKDLLVKLLGPTTDYWGEGLKELAQKRGENVDRIFQHAVRFLGEKINQPGQVPPKVLKTIINDGSYNSDPLAAAYFGGVLASSRTDVGRDDRGARMAKIVDGLTAYQLRAHFCFYTLVNEFFKSKGYDPDVGEGRGKMGLFISAPSFYQMMQFDSKEISIVNAIVSDILGLATEELIGKSSIVGHKDFVKKQFPNAEDGGILLYPSLPGFYLYLWAHGLGDKDTTYFFDVQNTNTDIPIITQGVTPTTDD